jgi:hypothetical protein
VIQTAAAVAHHNFFTLPPLDQGHGKGRRVVRRSLDLYDELGLERVRLLAVDIGTYVWAMAGFDFESREDRQRVMDATLAFAQELGFWIRPRRHSASVGI